jgi:hypothetical protein
MDEFRKFADGNQTVLIWPGPAKQVRSGGCVSSARALASAMQSLCKRKNLDLAKTKDCRLAARIVVRTPQALSSTTTPTSSSNARAAPLRTKLKANSAFFQQKFQENAIIVKLGMMTGAEITHDDSTEITQISAALKLVLLHKHLMETEKNKILSYLLA